MSSQINSTTYSTILYFLLFHFWPISPTENVNGTFFYPWPILLYLWLIYTDLISIDLPKCTLESLFFVLSFVLLFPLLSPFMFLFHCLTIYSLYLFLFLLSSYLPIVGMSSKIFGPANFMMSKKHFTKMNYS